MNANPPALSLSGPAIEERFAEVDGARMRYLRAGSGPPLVLLHGLMGYSFSWRFNLPVLAKYATVYAPDLLGAGFSDRPAELDCRLCAIAERVLQFLKAVEITDFDLLGTSHGGAVAMMVASLCLARPDFHLRKLVLVAPVNPWSAHGRRLAPFLGSPLGSKVFLRSIPFLHRTFGYWLARLYGDPKRIPEGTLEGYKAPVISVPGAFEYGLGIVRHWTADLRLLEQTIPQLSEIPTLLMWGSADAAVYAQSAETLRHHFKQCEVVIYPGIGHLPYEEAPEQFNTTLITFLASFPKPRD